MTTTELSSASTVDNTLVNRPTIKVVANKDWSCVGLNRSEVVAEAELTMGEATELVGHMFAMRDNVKMVISELSGETAALHYEYCLRLPREQETRVSIDAHYWYRYEFSVVSSTEGSFSELRLLLLRFAASDANVCSPEVFRQAEAAAAASQSFELPALQ